MVYHPDWGRAAPNTSVFVLPFLCPLPSFLLSLDSLLRFPSFPPIWPPPEPGPWTTISLSPSAFPWPPSLPFSLSIPSSHDSPPILSWSPSSSLTLSCALTLPCAPTLSWDPAPPEPGPCTLISPSHDSPSFSPLLQSSASIPRFPFFTSLFRFFSPPPLSPPPYCPTHGRFSWDPGGFAVLALVMMFGFYVHWLVSQSHIFISLLCVGLALSLLCVLCLALPCCFLVLIPLLGSHLGVPFPRSRRFVFPPSSRLKCGWGGGFLR
jgi:hypothetical protein